MRYCILLLMLAGCGEIKGRMLYSNLLMKVEVELQYSPPRGGEQQRLHYGSTRAESSAFAGID